MLGRQLPGDFDPQRWWKQQLYRKHGDLGYLQV